MNISMYRQSAVLAARLVFVVMVVCDGCLFMNRNSRRSLPAEEVTSDEVRIGDNTKE
jgi:hypothetical protein